MAAITFRQIANTYLDLLTRPKLPEAFRWPRARRDLLLLRFQFSYLFFSFLFFSTASRNYLLWIFDKKSQGSGCHDRFLWIYILQNGPRALTDRRGSRCVVEIVTRRAIVSCNSIGTNKRLRNISSRRTFFSRSPVYIYFACSRVFADFFGANIVRQNKYVKRKGDRAPIHWFYVATLFIVQYIELVDTIRCVMRHNNGIFFKIVHCQSGERVSGETGTFAH